MEVLTVKTTMYHQLLAVVKVMGTIHGQEIGMIFQRRWKTIFQNIFTILGALFLTVFFILKVTITICDDASKSDAEYTIIWAYYDTAIPNITNIETTAATRACIFSL